MITQVYIQWFPGILHHIVHVQILRQHFRDTALPNLSINGAWSFVILQWCGNFPAFSRGKSSISGPRLVEKLHHFSWWVTLVSSRSQRVSFLSAFHLRSFSVPVLRGGCPGPCRFWGTRHVEPPEQPPGWLGGRRPAIFGWKNSNDHWLDHDYHGDRVYYDY